MNVFTDELVVLQTVRLKGRTTAAALRETLENGGSDGASTSAAALASTLAGLTDAGLLIGNATVRLSAEGLSRCQELLAAERARVDVAMMSRTYRQFQAVNTEFKTLVTEWQLSHDPRHLDDLPDIHRRVVAIICAAAAQSPRLAGYGTRLQHALDRINSGDIGLLTRPLTDSYHTVWFELHEELIGACGRSRGDDD